MSKITVIGAGNVGATCANVMAHKELAAEIVLLDIKKGFAEGKALDMMQTAELRAFDTRIKGVNHDDYAATAKSDVIVITSGIPRKPGMTREELVGTNANIVKEVIGTALGYSPNAVIVMISNPLDTMTYLTLKVTKVTKQRVLGMGGVLDSSRFKYYVSKALGVPATDIQGTVIGGHGDATMIPLTRYATYNGIPITDLLDRETVHKIVSDTMKGGATLTGLLGTSAWYAPGAATSLLVESIMRDQKKIFPCCVALEGEYGQRDICIGVPVVVGRNGWEKIVDVKLNEEEQLLFNQSADAVRKVNSMLIDGNLI
jgi:malate dehydrogenase